MADNAEPLTDNTSAFDPSIQTENIAFDTAELIPCRGCGRSNAPTRFACIYCGRELESTRNTKRPAKGVSRKLEPWERGFNVIFCGGRVSDHAKAATLLALEVDDAAAIFEAGAALPLARCANANEATAIAAELKAIGAVTRIISDDELLINEPTVRLSRVDIDPDGFSFVDFNRGEVIRVSNDELRLIVTGTIVVSKVDAMEKKRRRGRTGLIDEVTTVSDEMVLDLYTSAGLPGFRVHLAGFDFSCLGSEKGLLAAENLRLLTARLHEKAANAKFVGNYRELRGALGPVWEIEDRNDPKGLRRTGFGRKEFGSVATTSNLGQFTKFSRLQWYLL